VTRSMRTLGATAVVLLLIASAAATLRARDHMYPRSVEETRLLYLTSGDTIGTLALGFDSVLADVYWIRTVQHYGRDRDRVSAAGRYELLGPLIDITTSLDPYFTTAYIFGSLFLAEPFPTGPDQLDKAIALLEKGLAAEPSQWQYAQYIGFLHYWHGGDRQEAARQFQRAADIPGSPNWMRPVAANMFIEGGDRQAARVMLEALAKSEERWIRELAERKLRELGPA
jgi:tetratricopeptide (TPR) repeat protein